MYTDYHAVLYGKRSFMRKFVLSRKDSRKHLAVTKGVHEIVCFYAEKNDITIAEATHILLGKALAREFCFRESDIASIGPTR